MIIIEPQRKLLWEERVVRGEEWEGLGLGRVDEVGRNGVVSELEEAEFGGGVEEGGG